MFRNSKEHGKQKITRRPKKRSYNLLAHMVIDASQRNDHRWLNLSIFLLYGNLESGSIFQTMFWNSHTSQNSLKSFHWLKHWLLKKSLHNHVLHCCQFERLVLNSVSLSIDISRFIKRHREFNKLPHRNRTMV